MSDYMSLNTLLMRSTFKIEGRNSGGTAFIIGQPLENNTDRARYVLVTAAHVLEEMSGSHATFFLRKKLNEHFEKFAYSVEIRRSREPLWVKHPDVDVAAMYLSLPEETDIQLATTNNMGDDEALREYEIVPGDEVMCLGYPLGAEANEAGFSILRSGKIASYPLVPTRQTKSFLYDFQTFPGNSGGPVFFVQSGRTYKGAMRVGTIRFIIGIISKEKIVTETIESLYQKREEQYPLRLAEVVHASFIKETVELLPQDEQCECGSR